tara:strand:- start:8401 stop:8676 length:276 start_codon:yes stop_codon:yes gene_type:complete
MSSKFPAMPTKELPPLPARQTLFRTMQHILEWFGAWPKEMQQEFYDLLDTETQPLIANPQMAQELAQARASLESLQSNVTEAVRMMEGGDC